LSPRRIAFGNGQIGSLVAHVIESDAIF
jgi:hypothetical protein